MLVELFQRAGAKDSNGQTVSLIRLRDNDQVKTTGIHRTSLFEVVTPSKNLRIDRHADEPRPTGEQPLDRYPEYPCFAGVFSNVRLSASGKGNDGATGWRLGATWPWRDGLQRVDMDTSTVRSTAKPAIVRDMSNIKGLDRSGVGWGSNHGLGPMIDLLSL